MALLKWYDGTNWKSFFSGAFNNIFFDLKNINTAINNMAKAVRNRCRRDKNLSDITDAADGRMNLGLINDCSSLLRAPHHHDSRYNPKFTAEANARKSEDDKLWDAINGLEDNVGGISDIVKDIPPGSVALIDQFDMAPDHFYIHFSNGFMIQSFFVRCREGDYITSEHGERVDGTLCDVLHDFSRQDTYIALITTDEIANINKLDQELILYVRPYDGHRILVSTYDAKNNKYVDNNQRVLLMGY